VLAAAGCWLLSAPTANGQEAGDGDKLEEVMVTATRTGAQNVQNIPVAVTVINTDSLDRLGRKRTKESGWSSKDNPR
jgi:outer membrane cobalamin receptor